jgi:hypothetical protein
MVSQDLTEKKRPVDYHISPIIDIGNLNSGVSANHTTTQTALASLRKELPDKAPTIAKSVAPLFHIFRTPIRKGSLIQAKINRGQIDVKDISSIPISLEGMPSYIRSERSVEVGEKVTDTIKRG